MPSTYSSTLRIELIGQGEQDGTWGTTTNTNLGTLIEQAITGVQTITFVDANYTLTAYNGLSDEARNAVLVLAGTNTATRQLIAPSVEKTYIVKNGTGASVTIKTSSGTGITVPNGATYQVYCDGTEFYTVSTNVSVAAGTGISVSTAGSTTTVTNTGVTSAVAGTGISVSGSTGAVTFTNSGVLSISGGTTGLTPSTATTGAVTLAGTLAVANGGTGVTSSTGSGSVVLNNSPTLVTPALGTPASGTLTNCTGLPVATGISGLGSGVATFLATPSSANLAAAVTGETGSGALVFATSPALVTPALGTPSSGTLTSCTGLPISTGVSGLGTGIATALAVNVGTAGAPVVNGGALGTPASGTLTSCTGLPLTTGVTGTLPVANGGTGVTTSTGTGNVVLSASPTLTGTPLAPTASVGTDSTQIATTAFVRDIIPTGIISLWYGSVASVPSGWFLCDGTNGTPDLRDRFIVGAGSTYAVATTGGSANVTPAGTISGTVGGTALTEAQMPKHWHRMVGPFGTTNVQGGEFGYGNYGGGTPDDTAYAYGTWSAGGDAASGSTVTGSANGDSHTHSFSGTFTGTSGTNLPPYYALAYIMKA